MKETETFVKNSLKTMKIKLLSCSLVLASAAVLSGCSVPKNVAYFQDTETSAILAAANPQPITIKPDDKINIIVKTKDPAISDPLQSSRLFHPYRAADRPVDQRYWSAHPLIFSFWIGRNRILHCGS